MNSLAFSFFQLITSHFHLPFSLSPFELSDLFIFSINYLTFSSTFPRLSPIELLDLFICSINYLTFSSTSLSLSPLELPDLFISSINYLTFSSTSLSLSPLELLTSSFPQLIAPPISYLNPMLRFFFSLHVVPIVLLLFEFQRCVLSPVVSDWLCQISCFYLFIWFFCSAQYFYFLAFGVLCSVGFIIL